MNSRYTPDLSDLIDGLGDLIASLGDSIASVCNAVPPTALIAAGKAVVTFAVEIFAQSCFE